MSLLPPSGSAYPLSAGSRLSLTSAVSPGAQMPALGQPSQLHPGLRGQTLELVPEPMPTKGTWQDVTARGGLRAGLPGWAAPTRPWGAATSRARRGASPSCLGPAGLLPRAPCASKATVSRDAEHRDTALSKDAGVLSVNSFSGRVEGRWWRGGEAGNLLFLKEASADLETGGQPRTPEPERKGGAQRGLQERPPREKGRRVLACGGWPGGMERRCLLEAPSVAAKRDRGRVSGRAGLVSEGPADRESSLGEKTRAGVKCTGRNMHRCERGFSKRTPQPREPVAPRGASARGLWGR